MNTEPVCNLHNPRAVKARFGALFENRAIRMVLWTVIVASLAGWVWAVFLQHQIIGHLLFGISGSLAIPLFWYYGELKELLPTQDVATATDVSSLLSHHLLSKIKKQMSPQDLAKMVAKEQGAYFFGARFGIGADILQGGSSQDPTGAAEVWRRAIEVAQKTKSDRIDSAVLVVALVLAMPNHENLLAQLQLDVGDLLSGVGDITCV